MNEDSLHRYKFKKTDLGVCLIDYFKADDQRGGFSKIFEAGIYLENDVEFHVDELFVSQSSKNVIRGIHFQLNMPQAKIITVLSGKIYDVVVDLRKESHTLGKWEAFELDGKDRRAVYIPAGFGHGFMSLEENTNMLYICCGKYDKESDTGILYDDADLSIDWPCEDLSKTIHSARDLKLMSYKEYIKNPMNVN